jgi:hypothetical protein
MRGPSEIWPVGGKAAVSKVAIGKSALNKNAVGKSWGRAVSLTLVMFFCHGGALLLFLPGIAGRFGMGSALMLALPSLACWIALVFLLVTYKRHILPVNRRIEELIHDKPPLFPPKSIVKIYREISAIEDNIYSIQDRSRAVDDYIRILKKNKGGSGAGGLIEKQREYGKYFDAAYAEYGSLDLNMSFQFYISLIKEIIMPGEIIHRLDIEGFIETLRADLKFRMNVLMAYKDPDAGDAMDFTGPQETMAAIEKTIPRITTYLISAQSSKTIAGTSPLDEQNLLDLYYQRGYDIETALEHFEQLKKLDDEHDRFMAEQELSERRSK